MKKFFVVIMLICMSFCLLVGCTTQTASDDDTINYEDRITELEWENEELSHQIEELEQRVSELEMAVWNIEDYLTNAY